MTPHELFDKHVGLAMYILNRMSRRLRFHRDDYVANALEGLWESCVKFDPARGWSSGYAGVAIRRAIWGQRLIDRPFGRRHETRVTVETHSNITIPVDPVDPVDPPTDFNLIVKDLLGRIDKRSAQILKLRFVDGQTLDTIGAQCHITKERVRQIIGRALEKLEPHLTKHRDQVLPYEHGRPAYRACKIESDYNLADDVAKAYEEV